MILPYSAFLSILPFVPFTLSQPSPLALRGNGPETPSQSHVRADQAATLGQGKALQNRQSSVPTPVSTPPLSPVHLHILSSLNFNSPPNLNPPSSDSEGESQEPEDEGTTILSPLVLVHTLDGGFHALERSTGRWVWSLNSEVGTDAQDGNENNYGSGWVQEPVVGGQSWKTVASQNGAINKDIALVLPHHRHNSDNETGVVGVTDIEEEYLLEPYGDGDIYLRTTSHNPPSTTFQRLPFPLKTLVQLTPFTFPELQSRMFVGRKESKILRVEMSSGNVLSQFGGAEQCVWQKKEEGLERDCESSILFVGYTEYSLQIISKLTGFTLQTLTYKTFHPPSLSPSPWAGLAPDNLTLQSLPNGDLLCYDANVGEWKWHNSLMSPVIDIFDLSTSGNGVETMMHRQDTKDFINKIGVPRNNVAWIGQNTMGNGGRFVMSQSAYPLVAFTGAEEMDGELMGVDRLGEEEDSQEEELNEKEKVLAIEGPKEVTMVEGESQDVINVEKPEQGIQIKGRTTKDWIAIFISQVFLAGLLFAGWMVFGQQKSSFAAPTKQLATLSQSQPIQPTMVGSDFKLVDNTSSPSISSPKPLPPIPSSPSPPPSTERSKTSTFKVQVPNSPPQTPSAHPRVSFLEPTGTDISESETNDVDGAQEDETEGGETDGPIKKKKRGRRRGLRPGQKRAREKEREEKEREEREREERQGEVEKRGDENETIMKKPMENVKNISFGDEEASGNKIGSLVVGEKILGWGSHGTLVLQGTFQGRQVAVKRLLKDFVTIAKHEVKVLQESDDHPHVIRYFAKEQRDTFLYIALELCPASLAEVIEQSPKCAELQPLFEPRKALKQITEGLRHLHKLKIIHRDIKPQNILVSQQQTGRVKAIRMLISDFGLCKKLDLDESSFLQTANQATGSHGYRAPEVLRGDVNMNEEILSSTTDSTEGSSGSGNGSPGGRRLTRSLDIFSLGCVFYYVITRGEHPFGQRYEREMRILNGKVEEMTMLVPKIEDVRSGKAKPSTDDVAIKDLILKMVNSEPRQRPSADLVLLHPFFWNASRRLLFICDSSDRFEVLERDPPDPTLVDLEAGAADVVGVDWYHALDRTLIENLGKYRKYESSSVRDLLRVFRNKKNHFQDLPDNVKQSLGELPDGYLQYFMIRFPFLLMHIYNVVSSHMKEEPVFGTYFKFNEDL